MGFRILALLALTCMAAVSGQWDAHPGCEACFEGICHKINRIRNSNAVSIGDPIAIDKVRNIIYYHTGVAVKSLNLEDKTVSTVQEGVYSTGLAVDQGTRDLYFNSNKDIVKYNPVTKSTENIHGNSYFTNVYYKDKLYAKSKGPNPRFYVLKDSKFELFAPLQNVNASDHIIIDKRGDLYYRNDWATYKLPASGGPPVLFNDQKNFVFTTDKDGVAYFVETENKKIYRLNYETNELVEAGIFDLLVFGFEKDVASVHFDKYNNLIYINQNMAFYHLTPNTEKCRLKVQRNLYGQDIPIIEKL